MNAPAAEAPEEDEDDMPHGGSITGLLLLLLPSHAVKETANQLVGRGNESWGFLTSSIDLTRQRTGYDGWTRVAKAASDLAS